MKAAVLTAYGDADSVIVRDLTTPEPGPDELLVRVRHTSVTMGDTELRSSRLPWLFRIPLRLWLGWSRPRANLVLGMEVAGTVEAIGEGVTDFAVGDAVFGGTEMGVGAHAELAVLRGTGRVAHKPDDIAFDQVVALPVGGLEAIGYLRRGRIAAGQRVLIRGASGSIGTYAVQLAKRYGAHVTGVCGAQSVDRVAGLGADVVLDYEQRDFWQTDETWDLFLDVVGKLPFGRCLRAVNPGGTYVRATVPGIGALVRAGWAQLFGRRRIVLGSGDGTRDDLVQLATWLQQGELRTIIDRRYPLDAIGEAHRYVETGHKQGHVIIDVAL